MTALYSLGLNLGKVETSAILFLDSKIISHYVLEKVEHSTAENSNE